MKKWIKKLKKHPMAQQFCQNFQADLLAQCNNCSDMIEGVRYKCPVCPDFDFCETCEDTVQHPHAFIKLKPGKYLGNPIENFINQASQNFTGHPLGGLIQQFAPQVLK